ncbi:methyltransferase family protein [Kitasatospora sp. LaBMicrA B282]|uniref:methyltransferase family protein n=1 Tax=Kitasatospora sp. LaBMicrA B282 TaxID=3420949 RepID=UPI003D125559
MSLPSLFAQLGIVCWVGYELLLRRREDGAAGSWRADAGDRGSTRLLITAYLVAVLVNVLLGRASVGLLPDGVRWAGVAVLVGGLALRAWGMRTLGRYYTRTLRTVEEQRVVQEGPYRLIRHPGYCGSLLVWTGYSLGLGSWPATVLVAALLLVAYGWRIAAEERLLVAGLGPAYQAYRERSKRLIPFLY